MKFRFSIVPTKDPLLLEIVEIVNILVNNNSAFLALFKKLAHQFLDETSTKDKLTDEEILSIIDRDRIITIKTTRFDQPYYLMECFPPANELTIAVRALPAYLGDEISESHKLIYVTSVFLHEAAHLLTSSLNRIADNSNSKNPSTANDTHEKLGFFTFQSDLDLSSDCGFEWEITTFNGLLIDCGGDIKVAKILDPNLKADAPGNSILRGIPPDIIVDVVNRLRNWCEQVKSMEDVPFPEDLFSAMNFDELPPTTETISGTNDKTAIKRRMGLFDRADVMQPTVQELELQGIARKLFGDHFGNHKQSK